MHKYRKSPSAEVYNLFFYKTFFFHFKMALRLFILMMSRKRAVLMKTDWKNSEHHFSQRKSRGFDGSGLSELAAPSDDTSVALPFTLTGFPRDNRSSKTSFSLLAVPISAPPMTGASWLQPGLGTSSVGVAISSSSHVSEKA